MYKKESKYKWRFKNYPHVKVTENKTIVNTKTNREKRYTLNGYSKGVWITPKKFLTNINSHLELIPKVEYCPF